MSRNKVVFTETDKEIFSKVGYELILSGIVDYKIWFQSLKENIMARINQMDIFEPDIDRFINDIWNSEYCNENNVSMNMCA